MTDRKLSLRERLVSGLKEKTGLSVGDAFENVKSSLGLKSPDKAPAGFENAYNGATRALHEALAENDALTAQLSELEKAHDHLRDAQFDMLDDLTRAIESGSTAGDAGIKAVITGLEATKRKMLTALSQAGIEPIDALGQQFNHQFHHALDEMTDPTKKPGTVVRVYKVGFTGPKGPLRPAHVAIVAAAPRP